MVKYMLIYKKGDVTDIKGTGTIQNVMSTNVAIAKLEESRMLPGILLALW